MKRLRGIGVQLVIFFIIAISIPTFMLAIDVVVTTKSTQRSNMQLTFRIHFVHQLRLQAVQREHSLQQRLDIRLQAGLSQILQMVRQLIRKQL